MKSVGLTMTESRANREMLRALTWMSVDASILLEYKLEDGTSRSSGKDSFGISPVAPSSEVDHQCVMGGLRPMG